MGAAPRVHRHELAGQQLAMRCGERHRGELRPDAELLQYGPDLRTHRAQRDEVRLGEVGSLRSDGTSRGNVATRSLPGSCER